MKGDDCMSGIKATEWKKKNLNRNDYRLDKIIAGILRVLLTPIAFIYALYLFTWNTISEEHSDH